MQIKNNPKKQSILDIIQNLSNYTKYGFFILNKKLIKSIK